MKALTLTQPWATLVAIGAKKIETRSWATPYRGPVAIHAAKGYPRNAQDLTRHGPFSAALSRAGYTNTHELPLGAVVATALITECITTSRRVDGIWHYSKRIPLKDTDEYAFGDFTGSRFMWFLDDVVMLPEPVPARGMLGMWEWAPPLRWPFA